MKSIGCLLTLWFIACVSFGALLAEQQVHLPCPKQSGGVTEVPLHHQMAEAVARDSSSRDKSWDATVAAMTNRGLHFLIHHWSCPYLSESDD